MDGAVSLPLADKEVVLTFDDGPVPRYSNQILDILAAQCVKATFFLVGEMARAHPLTVRRILPKAIQSAPTAKIASENGRRNRRGGGCRAYSWRKR
jgi:peptidoglycan/xylan/chitin deacetylase (PgdA/CDA1 family)